MRNAFFVLFAAVVGCSSPSTHDIRTDMYVEPKVGAEPEPAAESKVESVVERCDKIMGTYRYAEHAYPGVPMSDLALVIPVLVYPGPDAPDGYEHLVAVSTFVKDGAVAYRCSGVNTPESFSVTFVRRL